MTGRAVRDPAYLHPVFTSDYKFELGPCNLETVISEFAGLRVSCADIGSHPVSLSRYPLQVSTGVRCPHGKNVVAERHRSVFHKTAPVKVNQYNFRTVVFGLAFAMGMSNPHKTPLMGWCDT